MDEKGGSDRVSKMTVEAFRRVGYQYRRV